MSGRAECNNDIFFGGPTQRLERSLGLVRHDAPSITQQAKAVALLGWAPLAVLVSLQVLVLREGSGRSFFEDYAAYARYLIAAPLLVLAEPDCVPRLASIARNFLDGGFVPDADLRRYQHATDSTRRLVDSKVAAVGVVILAYLTVGMLLYSVRLEDFPAWHHFGGVGIPPLSPAGWWHALVSTPLLFILLLGWLWRVLLWARFLALISRLNLRLIPGHPDKAGGLGFVSTSLRGFRLLSFAVGAMVAGTVANLVMHHGASPTSFKDFIMTLTGVVLILFVGPLTLFAKTLRAAKRRGVFEYGDLAGGVGRQFERKWLGSQHGVDGTALQAQDFSATTDLYSIVANVYGMRDVPFGLRDLGFVIVAAWLPFAPVGVMAVPLKVILENLAKLFL